MFIIITTMAAPVEEHGKHPHSPYLFVSPKTGTMFDPDSFRHTHEKILKAIGAEHIRFHDLRHPYVKHTTKIFSLRLMDFQAQAYRSRFFPAFSRHAHPTFLCS